MPPILSNSKYLLLACALLPAAARADNPPSSPSVPDIARRLGADDFTKREAAQHKLLNLPPDQLPAIRDAERQTNNEEASLRLRNGIDALELKAFLHPKSLTVDLHNATFQQFADVLNKQLGGSFIRSESTPQDPAAKAKVPTITLKATDQPLWEILRQVMAVQPFAYSATYEHHDTGGSMPQILISPALVPQAVRPIHVVDGMNLQTEIGGVPAAGNWELRCSLFLDPRIRVNQYAMAVHVDSALDQDGNPLPWILPNRTVYVAPLHPSPVIQLDAFFPPAPQLTRIKELRATATIRFLERQQTYTIDLAKLPVTFNDTPAGNLVVEQGANGGFHVATYTPEGDLTLPQPLEIGPAIVVVTFDAAGKMVVGGDTGRMQLNMTLPGGAGARRAQTMEIMVPEKVREVTLPIHVTDIALPGVAPAAPAR